MRKSEYVTPRTSIIYSPTNAGLARWKWLFVVLRGESSRELAVRTMGEPNRPVQELEDA